MFVQVTKAVAKVQEHYLRTRLRSIFNSVTAYMCASLFYSYHIFLYPVWKSTRMKCKLLVKIVLHLSDHASILATFFYILCEQAHEWNENY